MKHLDILKFWFDTIEETEAYLTARNRLWFGGDPETDAEIKRRFEADVRRAAKGTLAAWEENPLSCLALILLLDQFPLNIYRGQPRSFQIAELAVPVAKKALEEKFDERFHPVQRIFFYLPLEHSEDISLQKKSVALFRRLMEETGSPLLRKWMERTLWYAQEHYKVIDRFGRFPRRNPVLGRRSTPEEREYLSQGGVF